MYKTYSSYLAHHGIKGQKWGVRRYQNADGSYMSAGKSRRNSTKHKMTNAQKELAGVLGMTALSALAIGGSSYITNKTDFDLSANALTGQKMTDYISNINKRADTYDNLTTTVAKNPFSVSIADDIKIRMTIDNELRNSNISLTQATRRYNILESKKLLLKLSKRRREKLKEAGDNVQKLRNADTILRHSATKLRAALDMASDARRDETYRRAREQADEWWKKYASNNRQQSSRRNYSNNTSDKQHNQPRTKRSTSRTKSTDRAAAMKSKGVKVGSVSEETQNVKRWSKKVSDAQKNGTLTADMVEQLQNAKARKKIAIDNEQLQHGFICFCQKNVF